MNLKISAALLLGFSLILSACQKNDTQVAAVSQSAEQIVNVGTEGTYAPFSYQDKEGQLTGYDVEVVRLIGTKIPEMQFNFVSTPWDSMFLGLDAGKYQMIANQIAKSLEREQKYEFTNEPYFVSVGSIVVPQGKSGHIKTLADLANKKVAVGVGSAYALFLEDYNKQHGNPLIIQYYEGMLGVMLQDVASGKVDATVNDKIAINQSLKELGLKLELVGEPLNRANSYFIFAKNEEGQKIKAKVDQALDELRADGQLKTLSVQWFGEDFTQ